MNASPAATELSQEKPQGNCCLVAELINNADGSHNAIINMDSFDRFKYINKDNEGLSKTLQLGVSLCSGESIAILASDDEWLPDKFSFQVEFANNPM